MAHFEKRLGVNVPVETLFAWHEHPMAFERLVPPWENVTVVEDVGGIRDGGRKVMKMKLGPLSQTWVAEHLDYRENEQFRDIQRQGPFAHWDHTHRFEADGEHASILVDSIDYKEPMGPLGRLFGGGIVRRQLEQMFHFRHERTHNDLTRHQAFAHLPRKKIAITGASGLLGRALVSFWRMAGHEVLRVVRSRDGAAEDTLYWNPAKGEIDATGFEALDAVVHLAGESIAGGRWTDARKKRIFDSRKEGTTLIAETLAGLSQKPSLLISASAIGYYGDRGEDTLTEVSEPGDGFLADICTAWEEAATPAVEAGIRVVHPRIGIVLDAGGGALGQMLLPFKMGLGGVAGTGTQYMSWIAKEDIVAAFDFLLMRDDVEGPFNLTAPEPVNNHHFTKMLGKVLNRPTVAPLPGFAIKLALGEMGKTLLLEGAKVLPLRIEEHGFTFFYRDIESALRFELGRPA